VGTNEGILDVEPAVFEALVRIAGEVERRVAALEPPEQ
jgi:hypothetical protein